MTQQCSNSYTKRKFYILRVITSCMVMLFDRYNLPSSIFELVFATEQQAIVAQLLVDYIKSNDGSVGKTEMSLFATRLNDGELQARIPKKYQGNAVKLSYNKRQFYDRILTPLRTMGMIDYDMYSKKYKISENFNKEMTRIGLMWIKELRASPSTRLD